MDYQDVLAEVGAGSAHPGGPGITEFWSRAVDWTRIRDVLEVGCGTGRAITEVCQTHNCRGVGVDVRPAMIRKARKRAKVAGANLVRFQTGNATELALPDASFDLVFTESVNVFLTDPKMAVAEYFRLLRPGGVYMDVEMLVLQPVDRGWRFGVRQVYGAEYVPDQGGWRKLYKDAGFSNVRVLTTRSVDPLAMAESSTSYGTDIDLATPGAYQNPQVLEKLQANADWMQTNCRPLGYGVFMCHKDDGSQTSTTMGSKPM